MRRESVESTAITRGIDGQRQRRRRRRRRRLITYPNLNIESRDKSNGCGRGRGGVVKLQRNSTKSDLISVHFDHILLSGLSPRICMASLATALAAAKRQSRASAVASSSASLTRRALRALDSHASGPYIPILCSKRAGFYRAALYMLYRAKFGTNSPLIGVNMNKSLAKHKNFPLRTSLSSISDFVYIQL